MFELFDKVDIIFMQMYENTKSLYSFKRDKKREGKMYVYMGEKKRLHHMYI